MSLKSNNPLQLAVTPAYLVLQRMPLQSTPAPHTSVCDSQEKHRLSFNLSLQATGGQSQTLDCDSS